MPLLKKKETVGQGLKRAFNEDVDAAAKERKRKKQRSKFKKTTKKGLLG